MKLNPGEGYCIKCKCSRPLKNKEFSRYKNRMPVEKGNCEVCNTRMSRMLNKEEALRWEYLQAEGNPN